MIVNLQSKIQIILDLKSEIIQTVSMRSEQRNIIPLSSVIPETIEIR